MRSKLELRFIVADESGPLFTAIGAVPPSASPHQAFDLATSAAVRSLRELLIEERLLPRRCAICQSDGHETYDCPNWENARKSLDDLNRQIDELRKKR